MRMVLRELVCIKLDYYTMVKNILNEVKNNKSLNYYTSYMKKVIKNIAQKGKYLKLSNTSYQFYFC